MPSPSGSLTTCPVGTYAPPAGGAATLLPQLAAGPVIIERACSGCALRTCDPARCEDALRFERLVEELQTLEQRGLVRLWLRSIYRWRPGTRAMARAQLTPAGFAELAALP